MIEKIYIIITVLIWFIKMFIHFDDIITHPEEWSEVRVQKRKYKIISFAISAILFTWAVSILKII